MASPVDELFMKRALELSKRGEGWVEPNPMVGCVIADGETVIGEGWHQRFGGPHAEVEALRAVTKSPAGATMYVTLEPCCHFGKTPPCADAVIAAGIRRVVVAMRDPFPAVDGGGLQKLRAAGLAVESGLYESEALALNAPYLKLLSQKRPWVLAKWAMTLDGKIATRTGASQWISSPASRAIVHAIRGRMDAVIVGRGTVEADDPLLTARPAGPRIGTRVVLDSKAAISLDRQLVRTAREMPVLIAISAEAMSDTVAEKCDALRALGCDVTSLTGTTRAERMERLLEELGRRRMTNVLVEGGAEVLGSFFDARLVDEVHAFIAPKLFGGKNAPTPLGGEGIAKVADALELTDLQLQRPDGDFYLSGRMTIR